MKHFHSALMKLSYDEIRWKFWYLNLLSLLENETYSESFSSAYEFNWESQITDKMKGETSVKTISWSYHLK